MDATYDPSLPTERDNARLLLGDIDTANYLLKDVTIDSMISQFGYREGVAQLATSLAVRFAQDPGTYEADGGVKLQWSERVAMWRALAKDMRAVIEPPSPAVIRSGASSGVLSTPDTSKLRF